MNSLKKHKAITFIILVLSTISFIEARSRDVCPDSICGRRNGYLTIRFPFRLTNIFQPETCGYPGFNLYCDSSNRTLLYLPNSGNFTVQGIDYRRQEIMLHDPDDCLARKLLSGLDLSHSPFRFKEYHSHNLSLYECPKQNISNNNVYKTYTISCLSTSTPDHVVIGVQAEYFADLLEPWCDLIGNVTAPGNSIDKISRLGAYMLLTWDEPKCGLCEGNVTRCGLKNDHNNIRTLETICMDFDPPIASGQLSKKARYTIGISVGLGVPALIIIVVLLYKVITSRCRSREDDNNRQTSVEMAPHG